MAAPQLPLRRKLLYAAIVTAAAVALLFGVMEAGLRLTGYGYSPHFAHRVASAGSETVWRENRWCTAPYFSPALVRRPLPFRLPTRKAPGTYRIFVLGSSAAMGDPESSFSFARVLESMLHAAYPRQSIEVVNAAITATNSHLARRIASDCAALEPDLFIVYEGHNEVIGPFGPAGVFTPFLRSEPAVRLAAWTGGTRTGQLAGAIVRRMRSGAAAPAEWGGMQMFLQQQISADDPRLETVRDRLRANLRAIAGSARDAGAPLLLCTVLTNQRDFAPFLSRHRSNLPGADLARWEAEFAAAIAAERAGDSVAAERSFRRALAIDDRHAELVFRLGRLVMQAGRDAEARQLLQRALDLDALRFRTDSSLNQVIRDVAPPSPGATLVDLAQELAATSAHGIPGDDLLYEHVHLTFRGAYEIANRLFPAVVAELARRGLASGSPQASISLAEARQRLAFTTYEQTMIGLKLLQRFDAAPFSAQANAAERIELWQRRVKTANALLGSADATETMREIYRQALALAPNDWILARNAGAMLVARGRAAEALPLLQRAAAWIDDDVDTLLALAAAHRALGQGAEANAAIGKARALEPRHPALPGAVPQ
ncbi:MAG TPA: tetratricopeptide repeat protein [Opitutaceae bacterium]|nr:tetratricopeptide repeat protein [Opitutaceae bacterium]